MQPGLVQLQPSIDELMDTFEPLQGTVNLYYSEVLNNTYFVI